MTSRRARLITVGVLALMLVVSAPVLGAETPAAQMSWALHFSLAPTLFEPAETAGLITPFMILYALHDALVKPMPEKTMALPSLAKSWSTSPDGLVYEFVIIYGLSGIFGNAATRIEPFAIPGGAYAYGGYPDIDGFFKEQASELDPKKREGSSIASST